MQSKLQQKERQKAGSVPGHRCCDCNARQTPCRAPVCFLTAPTSVPGSQSWPIYWEKIFLSLYSAYSGLIITRLLYNNSSHLHGAFRS